MSKFGNKIKSLDAALEVIPQTGAVIMMGGFVGAGEPTCCIEWLIKHTISDITLITNEPGLSGFGRAMLYKNGLVKELISSHVGTTQESTDEYLKGRLKVEQFYPMGTWIEKVRAGAMGLGGVLVPVGVGILDEPGLFADLPEPKQVIEVNGMKCFVEPALTAPFGLVKAWRADESGNLEYRHTSMNCNPMVAMACEYTIAEVEEIVPVGTIPPERVGTAAPFVQAVVKGLSLTEHDEIYRRHWLKTGKLVPEK
ncbi:3-oxoacid coa-transferase subunit a [Lucifera butyrica]|uniref:3-oxoacid coa-transferase subunit a n=1 Tax=Lucifera butyrica TaxID=1351585 RepID=A0A498RIK6_9FIRM|nr:3-oxoacid CoA-transferase subunit A [Lucifera butyrica]VBB09882.1 3-oxoacid coa-transferase subunit a [Lucifera butyrica]